MMTGSGALKSLEDFPGNYLRVQLGGAIMPLTTTMSQTAIRHILLRHEQGAGHAAEGYVLRRSGWIVAIATSWLAQRTSSPRLPMLTWDSIPIIAITGHVSSTLDRAEPRFQEVDHCRDTRCRLPNTRSSSRNQKTSPRP